MVFSKLNQKKPVSAQLQFGRPVIFIVHGVRDAGGPASGEPVELTLTGNDACLLIQELTESMKACR